MRHDPDRWRHLAEIHAAAALASDPKGGDWTT
jgi:hypothetical protein